MPDNVSRVKGYDYYSREKTRWLGGSSTEQNTIFGVQRRAAQGAVRERIETPGGSRAPTMCILFHTKVMAH